MMNFMFMMVLRLRKGRKLKIIAILINSLIHQPLGKPIWSV